MTPDSCSRVVRAVFCLLLTLSVFQCQRLTEESPIVRTTKGKIRGKTVRTSHGKYVDSFTGIPYAKPPVGSYRFRHPKPIDPWDETFDATKIPNSCVQINDTMFGDFKGSSMWNANSPLSEDCLTLSVWVPRPKPEGAAVMVWFYGGGFYSGTTTLDVYDMKILTAEEEIVVVSINYRVASLGFLFFDRPDAPGNSGLFDQLMALEWVRDNIASFGGNPQNVTLFGESAGAVSVSLHLLSPLSRHLFSQGIMQSGGATAPWAVKHPRSLIKNGLELAKSLNCPHNPEDMDAIMECLRTRNAVDIVNSEGGDPGVVEFAFVPVVDGSFLDETPNVSLATKNFKKTNILLGSNKDEGFYFIAYFLTDLFKNEEDVYVTREDFIDSIKKLFPSVGGIGLGGIGLDAIIFEYTDWKNPDDTIKNREAIDRMVGDYNFACSVNEMALKYAESGSEVFNYFFTHRSSVNPWPSWMGVLHADEINFILGEPLNHKFGYTKDEEALSRKMMRYWANFAKTGNPSLRLDGDVEPVYWPPYTPSGKEYITLAVNSTDIGRAHRAQQCAFWNQFLPKLQRYVSNNPRCNSINGAMTKFPSVFLVIFAILFKPFFD